ncbi:hypothetical protein IT575_07010 [bacterium]|nr:hypothetical protein [bacterium]
MPHRLLVLLNNSRDVRGELRQLRDGEPPLDTEFKDSRELIAAVPDSQRDRLVLARAGWDSLSVRSIVASWPGPAGSLCMADDLLYLLGIEAAHDSLFKLQGACERAWERLKQIPDDLLAQLGYLVQESTEQRRLGWLEAELQQRHDVLSVPHSGDVEMNKFYPRKTAAAAPSRQEMAPDLLEKVFAARKALSTAFDEYEERPQQQEMVQAVEQALEQKQKLVVEAGTGVGKSLAYLLPLAVQTARTGKLGIVSTNTINLQTQLMEQDVPRLRRILDMLELRVTLLKGREHYLCLKRLQDLWLSNPAESQRRRARLLQAGTPALLYALHLLIRACLEPDGELDSVPAPAELKLLERAELSRSVDCGYSTCLGDRCEFRGECHFFGRRDSALLSHIAITNHALVFALFNPADEDRDNVATKCSYIVFDEAHNLESAITGQNTLEVNDHLPIDLGNRLLEILDNDHVRRRLALAPESIGENLKETFTRCQNYSGLLPHWMKQLAEARAQVIRLLQHAQLKGVISDEFQSQVSPATAEADQSAMLGLLGKLAARLAALVERLMTLATDLKGLFGTESSDMFLEDAQLQMDMQSVQLELLSCHHALNNWKPEDSGSITWFNVEPDSLDPKWEYKTAPLQAGPVFQALAAAKESVVLTSATLTVAGSFDYMKQSLGFSEELAGQTQWLSLDSPFDYASQSLLLVASDMAGPTGHERQRYMQQLEDVVLGVEKIFSRGILVLFNSYRDMNQIADSITPFVDASRLLVQGLSGSRQELADQFRESGDKLLLATRSFWEGFDVVGDALSCVVLAKLPFANFKDPIHAGRQRAIDESGGDSFRGYSLPLAATLLKQGFGRLIRSRRDHGCVFLLDSRAVNSSYGQVFIDSLPGPQIYRGKYSDCLDRARDFMAEGQKAQGTRQNAEPEPKKAKGKKQKAEAD